MAKRTKKAKVEEKREPLILEHVPGKTGIADYRVLSDAEKAAMNELKVAEEELLRAIDAMQGSDDVDKRWLNIGRTHLEQAFMALNRSIAKPQRITLPGDPVAVVPIEMTEAAKAA